MIKPSELRSLADEGDAIDWYGPGSRFTDPLREAADEIDRLSQLVSDACDDWETSITHADTITFNPAEIIAHLRSEIGIRPRNSALEEIASNNSTEPILANFEQAVRDGLAKSEPSNA